MTELNNALVLLTGAAGGFGRHMTQQFLAAGASLVLTDTDENRLRRLDAEQGTGAAKIAARVAADLGSEEGCQLLLQSLCEQASLPDILVNNAGIAVGGRFDAVPRAHWERVLQVNLLAPLRLTYLLLPQMLERGSGHVVNISSIAGWLGAPGASSYAATKFGLRGFSESLAMDLEPFGVKVSAVYPFFSRTPILDSEYFGSDTPPQIPLDMATDPADVVAEILKGIRKDRLHIFPDRTARALYYLRRFAPWMLPAINRYVQKRVFAE